MTFHSIEGAVIICDPQDNGDFFALLPGARWKPAAPALIMAVLEGDADKLEDAAGKALVAEFGGSIDDLPALGSA